MLRIVLALALLFDFEPSSAFIRGGFSTASNAGTGGAFVQLSIGAGGLVSGVVISADGKQLVRTDTAGANFRTSHNSKFAPVVTSSSMPVGDVVPGNGGTGVCAVAIAASNTSHVYMYFAPTILGNTSTSPPYVFSSTNNGGTWAHTTNQPSGGNCQANDHNGKQPPINNEWMDVSPANENVVYLATLSSGTFYTLNGGSSAWNLISTATIPAGTGGNGGVVKFDPSDATGNTVYIGSSGNGIWKCTAALTSPSCTKLTGALMPTTFKNLFVDPLGTVWVVDGSNSDGTGSVLRYLSGTWSTQLSGDSYTAIAVDPASTSNAYALLINGGLKYSINAQVTTPTWSQAPGVTQDGFGGCKGGTNVLSTVVPWQQWVADCYLDANNLAFDPSQSHVLYMGNGDGLYRLTPPTVVLPSTATISIASPAIVTMANTFVAGQAIGFATTGALPTGITAGQAYYVIAAGLSGSSFEFSTSLGGAAVNTTGTQSGTQSVQLRIQWNADETAGIENIDLTAGMALVGGGLGFSAQDRPLWFTTNQPTYPNQYYPNGSNGQPGTPNIRWGTGLCGNATANTYGGLNNNDGLVVSTTGFAGTYSTSGQTGLPGGTVAGFCAILTSTNWVWFPNQGQGPYFTNNSGTSWTACTFGGGKTAGGGGWSGFAQDSTSPGTLVIGNNGSGGTNGAGATGMWESNSTTACAFTQNSTSIPSGLLSTIIAVPGVACNFAYTTPADVGQVLPNFGNIYLTANCGVSFSVALSKVSSAIAMGFGKANPSNNGYPALYCQCYGDDGSGSKFGFFQLDNTNTITTPIVTNLDVAQGGYPAGNLDHLAFVVGDLATYGVIYGGYFQSGGFYRTP